MTQSAGFLGKICVIKLTQIGVICFAFLVSVFSNSSYADNAVTGSGTECVYGTLNTYTGPSTIKANWDPNTINLYWYNDEQKLTVQTAANTCNYDSGIALPSTNPTKTGYTFSGWEVLGGVPAGYTQLEYIQLSGTQWINTGIVLTDPTNIEQSFWVQINQDKLTEFQTLFGSMASSGGSLRYGINAYTGKWMLGINATVMSSSNITSSPYQLLFTTTQSTQTLKDGAGNVLVSSTFSSSALTGNTYVAYFGGRNNYGSAVNKVYGKLGVSYLKQNGTMLYYYVPAKRNSDSVVGMWDMVSGTFKTNAGSGTFTAGPAIQ